MLHIRFSHCESEEEGSGDETRNTHAYEVSPPCIVWFESLRSEEVVIKKSA